MMRKTGLVWLWIAVIIIFLDQLTKYLIVQHLGFGEFSRVLPFFNLTVAYNTGSAFSFLAQASGWQFWLFSIIAASVSLVIIYLLWRLPANRVLTNVSLTLILAGAVGNLIDRLLHGFVIDFIDLHLSVWHWPAFNVADSSIVIGCCLMIITLLRKSETCL